MHGGFVSLQHAKHCAVCMAKVLLCVLRDGDTKHALHVGTMLT